MNNTIIKTDNGFEVIPTAKPQRQNPVKPLPTYNPGKETPEGERHQIPD